MLQKTISSYLSGLTNMASACSTEIGPSFIEADSFDKEDFKKEFAKYFEIKEEIITPVIYEETLENILSQWIGKNNKSIVENLMYLIETAVGEPINVYTIKDESNLKEKMGRESGGVSQFYFVEDVIFAEFEKSMVCFSIGNNE